MTDYSEGYGSELPHRCHCGAPLVDVRKRPPKPAYDFCALVWSGRSLKVKPDGDIIENENIWLVACVKDKPQHEG